MDKEIYLLIEKAFEDGFGAGRAHEIGRGLGWQACWLFWRELYLEPVKLADSRSQELARPAPTES